MLICTHPSPAAERSEASEASKAAVDEPADELPDEPPAELAKETPKEPPKINADDLRRLHEVAYLGPEKSQTMWFANRHHPMVADWHVPALSS